MDEVYTYTRQQAMVDGFLVDVSEYAKFFDLDVPMAFTAALFDGVLLLGTKDTGPGDAVTVLSDMVEAVAQVTNAKGWPESKAITVTVHGETILALLTPGDRGENVITVGLEDDEAW